VASPPDPVRITGLETGVAATDRGDGWWDAPSFPFGRALLQP
jgi:hypothetical protein